MTDWMQDTKVVTAIHNYELARAGWLRVAPASRALSANACPAQQAAFDRMRAADLAYVWARDVAIGRAMYGFIVDEESPLQPSNAR